MVAENRLICRWKKNDLDLCRIKLNHISLDDCVSWFWRRKRENQCFSLIQREHQDPCQKMSLWRREELVCFPLTLILWRKVAYWKTTLRTLLFILSCVKECCIVFEKILPTMQEIFHPCRRLGIPFIPTWIHLLKWKLLAFDWKDAVEFFFNYARYSP